MGSCRRRKLLMRVIMEHFRASVINNGLDHSVSYQYYRRPLNNSPSYQSNNHNRGEVLGRFISFTKDQKKATREARNGSKASVVKSINSFSVVGLAWPRVAASLLVPFT